jgi:hypothetical protein
VDDLVVDDELTATVVDDEGADGATAISEGIADALEEAALGDDIETLLNITGLGHGDEAVVITEVQDSVGLEDGAEHGLDDHGGRGVGDEAGLLLQLAGEEVDTEVTVLAGLGGDRDADDLAGATLEDQDVANADEVARDGDGLANGAAVAGLDNTDSCLGGRFFASVSFLALMVVVVVGVQDVVGSALNAATEGVVLTLVVVVTHLASWGGFTNGGLRDLDFGGSRRLRVTGSGGLGLTSVVVVGLVVLGLVLFYLGLAGPVVDSSGQAVGGAFTLRVGTDGEGFVHRGTISSEASTNITLGEVELVLLDLVVDLGTVLVIGLLIVGVAVRREDVSPCSTGTRNIINKTASHR